MLLVHLLFVLYVLVFVLFFLPLGVGDWLRFVIVALLDFSINFFAISHCFCIAWTHYSVVMQLCSNLRMLTAILLVCLIVSNFNGKEIGAR